MKIFEYIQLAVRTESPVEDGPSVRIGLQARLMHGVIGLVTEAGELLEAIPTPQVTAASMDRVNVSEELGDIMWYVAIVADEMGVYWNGVETDDQHYTPHGAVNSIAVASSQFMDLLKKHVYYNAKLDGDVMIPLVESIIADVEYLAKLIGSSLAEVMKQNIAKLRTRYPERFTSEAAQNRDLNAERETLEQS